MPTVRELLSAWGLRRIAAAIQASAKPSLRLSATSRSKGACARIGGARNLPRNLEWPAWKGQPLAFLAQFDLAALPEIPGFDLPREGALFFFHQAGENPAWGYDPRHRGSARVLHTDRPLGSSALRPQPRALEKGRQYTGLRLRVEPLEWTIPDSSDLIVRQLGLSDDEERRYDEMLEAISTQRPDICHRTGGYPDHIQNDMRLEAQLVSNGMSWGNSDWYGTPKARRLEPGAAEWELLFQIDSEERAGMMWGDTGRIYFLIRNEDLRKRRFNKVWAILQCG